MTVPELLISVRPSLLHALRRSFPRDCAGVVEDAVSAATVEVLRRPERFDPAVWGGDEARRRVHTVAWRVLARQHRRPSARFEIATEQPREPWHTAHALALAEAREVTGWARSLVRAAARQYGGRRPERLEAALRDRIDSGDTDTEVARRHGLPRETLNRARGWLLQRLQARVTEARRSIHTWPERT